MKEIYRDDKVVVYIDYGPITSDPKQREHCKISVNKVVNGVEQHAYGRVLGRSALLMTLGD